MKSYEQGILDASELLKNMEAKQLKDVALYIEIGEYESAIKHQHKALMIGYCADKILELIK